MPTSRNEQHEQHLGHLADGLLAGRICDLDLGEELVGILIVESERDADQDRGGEKYREVPRSQQPQRIESEQLFQAGWFARARLRRRARQGEAVEP